MDVKIKSAILYPLDRDLNKTWFVQFIDEYGACKKMYGKLNHLSTLSAREAEADKITQKIESKIYESYPGDFPNPARTELPKLFPLDRDMNKTWFVQYKAKSDGRIKKIYGQLNNFENKPEREREARKIIENIPFSDIMPKKNSTD